MHIRCYHEIINSLIQNTMDEPQVTPAATEESDVVVAPEAIEGEVVATEETEAAPAESEETVA